MIIEYKKESDLTKYFEEKVKCTKFKEPGWLEKIGFNKVVYPDVYFHTGSLNPHSKLMIENSKNVIVNSGILKDELMEKLVIKNDVISVIFPANDTIEFKKSEVQDAFFQEHNIPKENRILYFTALNFKRSGFENFCDILTKIESTNFSTFITCNIDKELVYAKSIIKKFNLEDEIIILEEEIFDIADIFLIPTLNKNFSLNVVKAMSNKSIVFLPENNNAIEILDVFSIMDEPNDSNTAYKIDMLLRVPSEFKKVRKESYAIGKKLNSTYQKQALDTVISKLIEE